MADGEGLALFAVGHMALAYLLGKASAKPFHLNVNIPLLLVVSLLPDVDLVFEEILHMPLHRGPTHSLLTAALIFVPIFMVYRQKALPYFLALISHGLIGDFAGGSLQLLWPISTTTYGLPELSYYSIKIFDPINVTTELILFTAATLLLLKTNDWKAFLKNDKTNLLLAIPIVTVLLPTVIGYPFSESLLLTEPVLTIAHLFYFILFSIAILKVAYTSK